MKMTKSLCGKNNPMYGVHRFGEFSPNWKGGKVKIICEQCGKEIMVPRAWIKKGEGRFCSRECFYKWHKTIKGKKHPQFNRETIRCMVCNDKVELHPSRAKNQKFCGYTCRGKYYSGNKNSNWNGGISSAGYPYTWTKTSKEAIRQRDNYICQFCSKTQNKNGRKLDVHHIDYNKQNLNPNNLISLCINCHSKTYFNRGYWCEHFNDRRFMVES